MPSRVIRDGILESESVNALSWEAELFFRRLMSVVDDFGRYNALPMLLRSRCYPLQFDRVSDKDVAGWLKACDKVGLLFLYVVDNKPYLEILNFAQRTRQKFSKFPAHDDRNTKSGQPSATNGGMKYRCRSYAHEDEDENENEDEPAKKRRGALSKKWKPNKKHEQLAGENKINLKSAVEIFRDWAIAGGKQYVDWDATFRNALKGWLRERAPMTDSGYTDATGEVLKRW